MAGALTVNGGGGLFPCKEPDGFHLGVVEVTDAPPVALRLTPVLGNRKDKS